MGMKIDRLKEIGKDIYEPGFRTGNKSTGKAGANGKPKMPRPHKCSMKGSKYCVSQCQGDSTCPRDNWRWKELAGFVLIRPWHGYAIDHPEKVGRWIHESEM